MEIKEAILNFQYSEKMKSGLIIAAALLTQVASLNGDELAGGKKVLIWYLEGLLRELRIAGNVMGEGRYEGIEGKIMELMGRIEMSQFQEALYAFSEAISLATTSCQGSMAFLVGKKLI